MLLSQRLPSSAVLVPRDFGCCFRCPFQGVSVVASGRPKGFRRPSESRSQMAPVFRLGFGLRGLRSSVSVSVEKASVVCLGPKRFTSLLPLLRAVPRGFPRGFWLAQRLPSSVSVPGPNGIRRPSPSQSQKASVVRPRLRPKRLPSSLSGSVPKASVVRLRLRPKGILS